MLSNLCLECKGVFGIQHNGADRFNVGEKTCLRWNLLPADSDISAEGGAKKRKRPPEGLSAVCDVRLP
jgi:hypothetical protein